MSEPTPEQAPACCVLFVVQASDEMNTMRLSNARLHIDQTIDLLLKRLAPTPEIGRAHV